MSGLITGIAAVTISAIGAGMSFSAAAKAKKRAAKAEKEQKRLMAAARKRAEKNFFAGLNVPLDAFDEEYRQNIAANQQMIQQLQEGDPRNLAAGVGALGQATAEANEMTRIGMQKDLYENAEMKAKKRDAINQELVNMDVGAAADEAMRERDLQAERAQHIQSGVANIGGMVSAAGAAAPLFSGGAKNQATLDAAKDQNVAGAPPGTKQVIEKDGVYSVYNPKTPNPKYATDKTQPEFIPGYQKIQVGGQDATKVQILEMIQQQGLTNRDVGRLSRDKYDFGGSGKRGKEGWGSYDWSFLYQ
jgi:hypothetical protein